MPFLPDDNNEVRRIVMELIDNIRREIMGDGDMGFGRGSARGRGKGRGRGQGVWERLGKGWKGGRGSNVSGLFISSF